eukprot:3821694-Pleurochrysis_carterae.AAC.5
MPVYVPWVALLPFFGRLLVSASSGYVASSAVLTSHRHFFIACCVSMRAAAGFGHTKGSSCCPSQLPYNMLTLGATEAKKERRSALAKREFSRSTFNKWSRVNMCQGQNLQSRSLLPVQYRSSSSATN